MITKHDCRGETCGTCEQDLRIKDNMKADLAYAIETEDHDMFQDIFEDRDPFEFI
jgi:hypothetical protein